MHTLGAHVSKPMHLAAKMCTQGAGCTLNFEHCMVCLMEGASQGTRCKPLIPGMVCLIEGALQSTMCKPLIPGMMCLMEGALIQGTM